MADVVVGCCSVYGSLVSRHRQRVGLVTAAAGGIDKTLQKSRRDEDSKSSLKLHRTWNAGQRVSKEKYSSRTVTPVEGNSEEASEDETDSEVSEDEEEDDGFDQRSEVSQLNCAHFSRCPGCAFENDLNNPPVYDDAITFFQKRRIEELELTPSNTRGWRCRAKLVVRGTAEEPLIGLYEESSHSIVDIPYCRTHHPSINEVVEHVKAAITEVGIQPYNDFSHSGQLRYIQVVVNTYITSVPLKDRRKNVKVQVSLVWNARDENAPGSELLRTMADCLWKRAGNLHSVWANFQTTQNNVIFGHRWRRLLGHEQHWEHIGGVDVCFAPSNFGQANYRSFDDLLRKLLKYVRKGSAVTDLYAGVGVIGLSLAATRNCRIVKCVEVNKHCRSSFEHSLTRLPKHVDCKLSWHCADVAKAPLTWMEGSDVVIVDPPRKGLEPAVIDALKTASLRARGLEAPKENRKSEKRPWVLRAHEGGVQSSAPSDESVNPDGVWPDRLIYISCGWEAFKEDCESLEAYGYWYLARAHAFNFFPGTDSIEILAVFKAGKRNKKKLRRNPNDF